MRALRLIPIAATLAILSLPLTQVWAQEQASEAKTTTVTGCLMKGDQANQYKITENGVTYDLYPSGSLNLADHVGHKVTVTGKAASAQPGSSKKDSASRTTEERLEVTNLKHMSNTCP